MAVEPALCRRVGEVDADGDVDIDGFELAALDRRCLLLLIGECRARWEPAFKAGGQVAGIEKLMNAVSEELFRRRTGAE